MILQRDRTVDSLGTGSVRSVRQQVQGQPKLVQLELSHLERVRLEQARLEASQ